MIQCKICDKDINREVPVCFERGPNGENSSKCYTVYERRFMEPFAKERMCIPVLSRLNSFDNYEGSEALINDLKSLVQGALFSLPHFVLFTGSAGVGKTHLAISLMFEWAKLYPLSAKFRNLYDIMEDIKATFNGEGSSHDIIKKHSDTGILLLDDLGSQAVTKFQMDVLYQIINKRMENGHTTIITTNLNGDELLEMYDSRIVDRIGKGYVFAMNMQKSYRAAHNVVREYTS